MNTLCSTYLVYLVYAFCNMCTLLCKLYVAYQVYLYMLVPGVYLVSWLCIRKRHAYILRSYLICVSYPCLIYCCIPYPCSLYTVYCTSCCIVFVCVSCFCTFMCIPCALYVPDTYKTNAQGTHIRYSNDTYRVHIRTRFTQVLHSYMMCVVCVPYVCLACVTPAHVLSGRPGGSSG